LGLEAERPSVDLRRLINLHIATLVVASSVLFGIGPPSFGLPLLVLAAAVLADRYAHARQRFQVGRLTVNAAIVLIAMVTGWRLVQAHGTEEAVILGQSVAALQIVLMFERQTSRTRWDLISLSLLMVFLSTSFVHGPLFGVLLAAYFFVAFSTFALLLFDYEQCACQVPEVQLDGSRTTSVRAPRTRANWWRLSGIAVATLMVGPLSLFLRFGESSSRRTARRPVGADDGARRWPLLGQSPTIATVAGDGRHRDVFGREFRWRMGRITLVSIILALLFFCVAPRFGKVEFYVPQLNDAPWQNQAARRRSVGYSDRVRLGELGTVTEDQRMVFGIRFADHETGGPYRVDGEVYIRGAIKTYYADGHWDFREYGPYARFDRRSDDPLVRQTVTIKPSERRDLFCVWPVIPFDDQQPLRFDVRGERLYRPRDYGKRSFTYELATTAFDNGRQTDLVPCDREFARHVLLRWPAQSLQTLARLAQQWIDRSGLPANDTIGRARALESNLQRSGVFTYSLEEPERDISLDPIEDFVANNPQGNCEFFASALALMLRSQGIPSRLIVGYRAGALDLEDGTFQVRQYHAHAWVEAYVPPDQLPAASRPNNHSDWSRGAWLRLDPTPLHTRTGASFAQQVESVVEWVRSVWRDHILGMDGTQQHASIYQPLIQRLKEIASRLADEEQWEDVRKLRLWKLNQNLIWRAWLAGLGLALCFVLVRSRWRPSRLGRRRPFPRGNHRGIEGGDVGFYAEFEAILARHGQTRRATQTQREFAVDAGQRIAEQTGEEGLPRLALDIVDTFYCVRFGRVSLDGRQARAVDEALSQIKQAGSRPQRK
jgi:transglutaminase-like putative cysteine protease